VIIRELFLIHGLQSRISTIQCCHHFCSVGMCVTSVGSEIKSIMNVREFINHEVELYPNSPYIPIEEGIIGTMLDERDNAIDNEPIEEAGSVQIGDVLVGRVAVKDVESAPINITPLIKCNRTLQARIRS
jgi:hypothetical protein